MSTRNPWVASARQALEELERRAEQGLSAMSAYRVLVLLARLEQARAAGLEVDVPASARGLGERVAASAERPDPQALLERLETELSGDENPFGGLLDVLLQLDDAVSLAESRGEAATELARLADAHVALAPDRVGALGDMAENRLATLPADAAIRPLWETVARAAVDAALGELPVPAPATASLTKRRLTRRLLARSGACVHVDVSAAPMVAQLMDVAAAEVREPLEPFETGKVGFYEEDGKLFLHVEIPPGRAPEGNVELHVSSGEREAVLRIPISHSSPRAAIALLGDWESLRARLPTEGLLAPAGERRVEVVLTLKEHAHGK